MSPLRIKRLTLTDFRAFPGPAPDPCSHPSAPNIPKQELEQAINAVENFPGLVAKK